MTAPLLAAVLIVKDEAANLPGCLRALVGLGDLLGEVVVYDTGSTDGTPELARAAGARVEAGYWDGDFARARNAAAALTAARWVLVVDADERVVADPDVLRAVLTGRHRSVPRVSRVDAVVLPLVNLGADGGELYAAPQVRIFRPERAAYAGRLHERVERRDGFPLRTAELPRDVVQLRHLGYVDPQVVRRKAERNLELAGAALGALRSTPDPDPAELTRALYHHGRTLLSCGRVGAAVEDLQQLLGLPAAAGDPVPERIWGVDVLAQLLLGLGRPAEVGPLVDELRSAGVDPRYCGWLEARAHLACDRYAQALPLLRTVDEVVDSVGRRYDLAPVVEAQLFAAARVGEVDEAAACCIRLMAGFGQVEGYGSLLLTLWGARPAAWLAELLVGADQGHRAAVVEELRGCGDRGIELADLLAGAPAPA